MSGKKEIFISHASRDETMADAFVDLLQTGVGVKASSVFCTSVEGLGVGLAENFENRIRQELITCPLVFVLLSPNFFQSQFCLCELGAIWVMFKDVVPILIPPLEHDDVSNFLDKKQMMRVSDSSAWDELRDRVKSRVQTDDLGTARWGSKRDQFLRRVPRLLEAMATSPVVTQKKYDELKEKYESLLEDNDALQDVKTELTKKVADLEKCKDAAQVSKVRGKYSNSEDQFNSLVDAAKDAMKPLSRIARKALYYHLRREEMPAPTGVDTEGLWDDIRNAMEYKELVEGDNGGYAPDQSDPKVERALSALMNLRTWMGNEAPEDFCERFVNKHDYNPEMDNMQFWDGILQA